LVFAMDENRNFFHVCKIKKKINERIEKRKENRIETQKPRFVSPNCPVVKQAYFRVSLLDIILSTMKNLF